MQEIEAQFFKGEFNQSFKGKFTQSFTYKSKEEASLVRPHSTISTDQAKQNDLWACGVVLYELLSGQYPFDGWTAAEVKQSITKGKPHLGLIRDEQARQLLTQMFQQDRRDRP